MKISIFGAPQPSLIFVVLSKDESGDETMKIILWKRPILLKNEEFLKPLFLPNHAKTVPIGAAPGEELDGLSNLKKEERGAAETEAEGEAIGASDDRGVLNRRSAFGSEEVFGRLEMSPERFQRLTEGSEAAIAISEEKIPRIFEAEVFEATTKVFEEQPLPKLFEEDKRKKILRPPIQSGEFRKDEPRTPADVKEGQRRPDDDED
jgi:hypothetical protein